MLIKRLLDNLTRRIATFKELLFICKNTIYVWPHVVPSIMWCVDVVGERCRRGMKYAEIELKVDIFGHILTINLAVFNLTLICCFVLECFPHVTWGFIFEVLDSYSRLFVVLWNWVFNVGYFWRDLMRYMPIYIWEVFRHRYSMLTLDTFIDARRGMR